MAEVLRTTDNPVFSSDLVDRGYGEGGIDFLTSRRRSANIVINPPYNTAEGFLNSGLARGKQGRAAVAVGLPRGGSPAAVDFLADAAIPGLGLQRTDHLLPGRGRQGRKRVT